MLDCSNVANAAMPRILVSRKSGAFFLADVEDDGSKLPQLLVFFPGNS